MQDMMMEKNVMEKRQHEMARKEWFPSGGAAGCLSVHAMQSVLHVMSKVAESFRYQKQVGVRRSGQPIK